MNRAFALNHVEDADTPVVFDVGPPPVRAGGRDVSGVVVCLRFLTPCVG
jgi:hypothetical protein